MADSECVMGIAQDDWEGLSKLSNIIYNDGVYHNTVEYTLPDPDDATFKPLLTAFNKWQTIVTDRSGGKPAKDNRDVAGKTLHDTLKLKLLVYVNKTYRGNIPMLRLSGFPLKADAQRHGLAAKLEIDEIIPLPQPFCYRIKLKKRPKGSGSKTREKITYTIYRGTDPSKPETFVSIGIATNMNKLFLKNVDPNTAYWYAVTATNAAGENDLSGSVKLRPD